MISKAFDVQLRPRKCQRTKFWYVNIGVPNMTLSEPILTQIYVAILYEAMSQNKSTNICLFFNIGYNMVINTMRSRYMLHCSRNNFMVRLCVYREFEILPKFYFWNCCAVNNIGVCCTVIYWKSIVFLPFLFLSAGLCTQPFLHTVNLTGHGRCGSNVENDFFQTRFTDSYLSQFRWKPLNHID